MAQEVSTRVQLTLEQIGEDEALTSDLTDPAATALLEWVTQQVQAADAAPDDEWFQGQVKSIRSAAKTAARTAADEDVTAAMVVEHAQAALQSSAPPATIAQPQPPAPIAPAATTIPAAEIQAAEGPSAARPGSLWNSLRRRLRRWTHRKV